MECRLSKLKRYSNEGYEDGYFTCIIDFLRSKPTENDAKPVRPVCVRGVWYEHV